MSEWLSSDSQYLCYQVEACSAHQVTFGGGKKKKSRKRRHPGWGGWRGQHWVESGSWGILLPAGGHSRRFFHPSSPHRLQLGGVGVRPSPAELGGSIRDPLRAECIWELRRASPVARFFLPVLIFFYHPLTDILRFVCLALLFTPLPTPECWPRKAGTFICIVHCFIPRV